MDTTCDVCDRRVDQPKRGYRLRHAECAKLHEDIERMRGHLEQLKAGTHPVRLSTEAQSALWFRLFCLVGDTPRPRDARGRYTSSGSSPEYERTRARRLGGGR
jgi:hypothetical protein